MVLLPTKYYSVGKNIGQFQRLVPIVWREISQILREYVNP